MALSPGVRLGPYEVVAPLGAGGMGEVYRARDTRLGRDVAVKVVHPRLASDPERLSRFEKEARAAAQLDHPNILVVHDVGTHEGSPFIVSELLQGESLREKLGTPLPPKKAVDYAIQIAHGLAAAHEKGIVHRDIKPENVFVTKDGHVKILDFGVAKLLPSFEASGVDTETPTESVTQPGTAVGTVAYMSPEQIRGQPLDARTDLFSFGVVLYEMLAGKRPFQRETPAESMTAILREEPPDLSETNRSIPAALENVVRHCLEKDPEGRFQSARDVVFALETLPDLSAVRDAAPMSPAGVWLHRHRRTIAGAAIVLVLVAAGTLLLNRRYAATSKSVPSVLALPCKVYGAPEVAYLTDAVPGTISTLLSQVEGLDTKVPPTSFEVEKVKGDLGQLAELYKVSSFIVTSITTSANLFTLNVQLVDAATRKVRWAREFEGSRDTYNDLARQAAEGVRVVFSRAAAPAPTSTVSSEAELAFREGLYFLNSYSAHMRNADFDLALRALKRALDLDPTFAKSAAAIAWLYSYRWDFVPEREKDAQVPQIESWSRRATDLDPRCAEAWSARAVAEVYRGLNTESGLEYSLKAVRMAPGSYLSHYSLSSPLNHPGSDSLALAAVRKTIDLNPLYLSAYVDLLNLLRKANAFPEALSVADRALALEPGSEVILSRRVGLLAGLGRLKEAAESIEKYAPASSKTDVADAWYYARFLLALAEKDEATVDSLMLPLSDLLSGSRGDLCQRCVVYSAAHSLSPGLVRIGRKDDAMKLLQRSVELGLMPSFEWLASHPDMKLLHSDPRFPRVVAAARDASERVSRVLAEAHARGDLPQYLEKPLEDLNKLLAGEKPKT